MRFILPFASVLAASITTEGVRLDEDTVAPTESSSTTLAPVEGGELKDWWESADEDFSHIKAGEQEGLVKSWKRTWIDGLKGLARLKGKSIIEYGIGGGMLGQVLLEDYGAAKYTGIDIAERQLETARKRLKKFDPSGKKYALLMAPQDFKTVGADVFVCQAVMQHFPGRNYTIEWLQNLDRSGLQYLMLQPRHSSIPKFKDEEDLYESEGKYKGVREQVRYAAQYDSKFILEHLTNYVLVSASKVKAKTKYIFYMFMRRSPDEPEESAAGFDATTTFEEITPE